MQYHEKSEPYGASYDVADTAVVISKMTIAHPAVVTEAMRWSTGRRDEAVTAAEMVGADLTPFVSQALTIGAQAITSAGGTQDKFDLERLVTEVGTRTNEASTKAAAATTETVIRVAEAMQKASEETKKVIAEAGDNARKAFTDNVGVATKTLHDDIQRLLGGENPELIDRLNPLLETFSQKLDVRTAEQTNALLNKAVAQFDPSDPTSPIAKQTRALQEQQTSLKTDLEKNHLALVAKVDELATAVKVTTSAKVAAHTLAQVTPLKGETYADAVHAVMQGIASGLGDEYTDTGSVVGALARSKKGDGVLTVDGGAARLVLEMTDSTRTVWNDYLDEAERNREAVASLGLVRDPAQNGGQTIRCLGSRRIIMAFDPSSDDGQLLRTVIQLLRVAAIAASARRDDEDIQTAEEKITEAIALLTKIDGIRTTASSIRKGAEKIDGQCTSVHAGLNRLLTQAQTALSGLATAEGVIDEADSGADTHSAA